MEICVSTRAFPRAGMTFVSALSLAQPSITLLSEGVNAPVQVVARGEGRATRRNSRLLRVALDEEARNGRECFSLGSGGHFAFLDLRNVDVGHGGREQVGR